MRLLKIFTAVCCNRKTETVPKSNRFQSALLQNHRNQTADVESDDDVDTSSGEDRCLLGTQKRKHYTKNNETGNRVLNLKNVTYFLFFYPQEKEAKLDSKKIQHQTGSSSCTNVWE